MEKSKFKEVLDQAHEAGSNDTITEDHLIEGALLLISSDIGEVTDEEHEQIIEAYRSGFMGYPVDTFEAIRGPLEFQHNTRYIVIDEHSEGGYSYDIWNSKEEYENDDIEDSIDGGICTGTLSNAIDMALN